MKSIKGFPSPMRRAVFGAAIALAAVTAGHSPASAQPYNLTLCAASVGGTWSLIGAGIDNAVREAFPGSIVTIQTSAGGIANAASLQSGGCDFAIMHAPEVGLAMAGGEPFRAPMDNLRLLARIESWSPLHIMVSRELADQHGLRTVADIAAKQVPVRIVVQRPGNIGYAVSRDVLAAAGASFEQIEEWGGTIMNGASAEQANLFRDRRADVGMNVLFPGAAQVLDVAHAVPITLLSIPDEVRLKIAEQWNVPEFTISSSDYDFIGEDVQTVTLGAHLVTLSSMPEDVAQAVLTAIVDHAEMIASVHPSMSRLDVANFSGSTLPYHDAATAFYTERDMMPVN
ncbi:TAXI family TRAP transporter solute-binding subunit [Szabonella alba]|uniref:TAXI family TRAP transporter solute-binding subunit n=1 Tax=Szabonella alba TaxID=2804194 RepID=A0A8K0VC85_9RHOB|nr:TAXI family TRAP transporter solute-binding subunit [Szabonella alba]MBL4919238.1 TAXI family TRAP transporter solute-binding subunit [Szabonella alba]